MRLLFLDNDHVLNRGDKDRHPNRYLPLRWGNVQHLNLILEAVPDCQIIVSSAWRYHVLNGSMTLAGIEALYMHFGVNAHGRIRGTTPKDLHHMGDLEVEGWTPEDWHREGLEWRRLQILACLSVIAEDAKELIRYAVLDDLPLTIPNFVQTTREHGLTRPLANRVISLLKGAPCPNTKDRAEEATPKGEEL